MSEPPLSAANGDFVRLYGCMVLHTISVQMCSHTRVLHFAASLRGTRPYQMRQRSRLIAMVDTLGLPTVFFTHSAADLQWPELAHLICPDHPDDRSARSRAVIENPAVADWFFVRGFSS